MIVLHIVVLILIAVGMIWIVAFCVRATLTAEHLRGVLSLQGMNESEVATANFIKAVEHAEKSFIIHDDGNYMVDSIYNNQEAIAALLKQMKEHKSLRVMCWFNVESSPELRLVEAVRKNNDLTTRFEVKYRKKAKFSLWQFSWLDPHYKIADDGEYGTVSRHSLGSKKRRFRTEDCTQASPKGRDITLGPYIRRFNKGFGKAYALSLGDG